jgi:hypothetical protein
MAELGRLKLGDFEGESDEKILIRLTRSLWQPPSSEGPTVQPIVPGPDHLASLNQGVRTYTRSMRVPLVWKIEGAANWLDYWPDAADGGLTPTDLLLPEPSLDDEAAKAEWNRLVQVVYNRFVREADQVLGFVDILASDMRRPAEARQEEVDAEDALFQSYLERVRTAAELNRADIDFRILGAIRDRRANLEWKRNLQEGLPPADRPAAPDEQVRDRSLPEDDSSTSLDEMVDIEFVRHLGGDVVAIFEPLFSLAQEVAGRSVLPAESIERLQLERDTESLRRELYEPLDEAISAELVWAIVRRLTETLLATGLDTSGRELIDAAMAATANVEDRHGALAAATSLADVATAVAPPNAPLSARTWVAVQMGWLRLTADDLAARTRRGAPPFMGAVVAAGTVTGALGSSPLIAGLCMTYFGMLAAIWRPGTRPKDAPVRTSDESNE